MENSSQSQQSSPAESQNDSAAIPDRVRANAIIQSEKHYNSLYQESLKNPDKFWDRLGTELVSWSSPYTCVTQGGFKNGDIAWYLNGKLNVCYNCLDRHLSSRGDAIALKWEGNEITESAEITYRQLFQRVCQCANALKKLGVKKGDRVAIYSPMVPETAISMLACARIGAVHSVVFAGFSSQALALRIQDGDCQVVITANESLRGKKTFPLKQVVDVAVSSCKQVRSVIVIKRTDTHVPMVKGRDVWFSDLVNGERPYCPCEPMDAEDPWFMLYTSGSTGKPKGLLHVCGGPLVYMAATLKYIWGLQPHQTFFCAADYGWITGILCLHAPLVLGASTVCFEPPPTYPTPSRYWKTIEKFKPEYFYTSPTAIRALMKEGDDQVKGCDLSSLFLIGTVGEPIQERAWNWYNRLIGQGRCVIIDTWFQTETCSNMLVHFPGVHKPKPGCAGFAMFGIDPLLVDDKGNEIHGPGKGTLLIRSPWPAMARTVYGDHQRYLKTYMQSYPGFYFTGDGATRTSDGYLKIHGRIDDQVNVSGHRIGTAEIESCLVQDPDCTSAAVIALEHSIKGWAIIAFATTSSPDFLTDEKKNAALTARLIDGVKYTVGSFAKPEAVVLVQGIPLTRSGKQMRRILRKIANNEVDSLGDISTLSNPDVVEDLKVVIPKSLKAQGWKN